MTLEEIDKKDPWDLTIQEIRWLISRVKELEEGIRKHREKINQYVIEWPNISWSHDDDEELYKLLREG